MKGVLNVRYGTSHCSCCSSHIGIVYLAFSLSSIGLHSKLTLTAIVCSGLQVRISCCPHDLQRSVRTVGAGRGARKQAVRAVTFSFLCPLFEKHETFIAICKALIEKVSSFRVFIGKNLDAATIRAGYTDCITSPQNLERELKKLRFKVGDRVECNMSSGERQGGTVAQLMWRDEEMEPGQVCPYKVSPSTLIRKLGLGTAADMGTPKPTLTRCDFSCRSSWMMAVSLGPRLMLMKSLGRKRSMPRRQRSG
eukprot:SAG31_NODE_611_length_13558_cov_224.959730_17_plen_251_part_00